MKRILTLITLLSISTLPSMAQARGASGMNRDMALFFGNAIAILLVIWIASSFLLTIIRLFLNHRLRAALVEKNASEAVIAQILPQKNDLGQLALKWGCLLAAAGVGFTICYYSQPIGLHWAIIMSLSLAVGLFIFYFINKRIK